MTEPWRWWWITIGENNHVFNKTDQKNRKMAEKIFDICMRIIMMILWELIWWYYENNYDELLWGYYENYYDDIMGINMPLRKLYM